MTKVKVLAILVAMVLPFAIPATASAQRLPPHDEYRNFPGLYAVLFTRPSADKRGYDTSRAPNGAWCARSAVADLLLYRDDRVGGL